jgi:hypothetical protein
MTQGKGLKLLWFKVCMKSHEHKEAVNRKEKRIKYSELKTARRNFRKKLLEECGPQTVVAWGYDYSCYGTNDPNTTNTGRKHFRFSLDEPI